MADDKQQIEKQLSNDILKDVFQKLHTMIVDNINTSSVIGELFAAKVISTNEMQELHFISNPHKMCTRLLIILHKTKNPRTFIELREAIKREENYGWLVEKIDEKYKLMAPAVAQPQPEVTQDYFNLFLMSRDSMVEVSRALGDLARSTAEIMEESDRLKDENERLSKATATLTTENRGLLSENTKLKVDNELLSKATATLTAEITRLKDDNKRLCLQRSEYENKLVAIVDELNKELERVRKSDNYAVTPKVTQVDTSTGESESDFEESIVPPDELLKTAVLVELVDCPELLKAAVLVKLVDCSDKISRDADVIVPQSFASVCRLHNDPQLLFTLDEPPTDSDGRPREVTGVVMLDKYLYVVYFEYTKVEVFDCGDRFKKIKDIEVKGMKKPEDMVGSCVTLQLFICEWFSDVIWRLNLKTGVSDVFIKTSHKDTTLRLSLVENRFLVKSRESLLMFDIVSGKRIKTIPLPEDIKRRTVQHAIESNRDSFLVSHGKPGDSTVSEIDSEGRVIRVLDKKHELNCVHLALDSVGRVVVADYDDSRVVSFDDFFTNERILIENDQLDNARPVRLNYNKNNNRLTVGLDNGLVRIFEY